MTVTSLFVVLQSVSFDLTPVGWFLWWPFRFNLPYSKLFLKLWPWLSLHKLETLDKVAFISFLNIIKIKIYCLKYLTLRWRSWPHGYNSVEQHWKRRLRSQQRFDDHHVNFLHFCNDDFPKNSPINLTVNCYLIFNKFKILIWEIVSHLIFLKILSYFRILSLFEKAWSWFQKKWNSVLNKY